MKDQPRLFAVVLMIGLVLGVSSPSICAQLSDEDAASLLKGLSLEELTDLPVVSVTKTEQKLSNTPAAVQVITSEDIRRSGATSIPEALRMVPGLHVAVIDGNKWAVSARGFNGRFANKLLVLLDGRSVYTPLFSGVFWEAQDTIMEDIERIEVIRGPGATVWGANAVNGVINIITKKAADTQGGLVTLGTGTQINSLTQARYGGQVDENLAYRISVKQQTTANMALESGDRANDKGRQDHASFRMDYTPTKDNDISISGQIYQNAMDQTLFLNNAIPYRTLADNINMSGGVLQSSLTHRFADNSHLDLALSLEHTVRSEYLLDMTCDVLDASLEHRLAPMGMHELVWGLGYRLTSDDIQGIDSYYFTPERRSASLASGFLQDTMTLMPETLQLTLGTKIEHNDFTGAEIQPGVRLLWTPTATQSLWAAVSRAVHTPSRADSDLTLRVMATNFSVPLTPQPMIGTHTFLVQGNDNVKAEDLTAFEIGYRVQPSKTLLLDANLFYNKYDGLQVYVLDPSTPSLLSLLPLRTQTGLKLDNAMDAESFGLEVSATTQLADFWRLVWGYSWIHVKYFEDTTVFSTPAQEDVPEHQFSLRSTMDLPNNLELDSVLSFQAALDSLDVDAHVRLDVRLGWKATPNLEVSVIGQNLLEARHTEYSGVSGVIGSCVERSVFGKMTWRF